MKWIPRLGTKTLLLLPLLLLAMHAPHLLRAQDIHQKITLAFSNIPLSNAFSQLQTASGISFTFSSSLLAPYTTGNIPRSEKTASEWVSLLLRNRPFTYQYISGNIIITPQQQQPPPQVKDTIIYYTVSGYIRDSMGLPVEGASVYSSDGRRGQVSDSNGYFNLTHISAGKSIQINAIGYLPWRGTVTGNARLAVQLQRIEIKPLDTVAVSTGYQQLNKDRTTGSFAVMDNQLVNRNILPNILDRLEGMMSSLQFIKNIPIASGANESTLSIRGRSTINSNPQPLIIMDNFPFDGDLSNINPNDIESVTLLKDAASANIWGAFSGNGVIVFTTKKGHYFQKPRVSLNTNYTISAKPNLYYTPALTSRDYIELETFAMNHDYYDLSNPMEVLSPAVEIMVKTRKGILNSLDSARDMQRLAATDTRTDLNQYFYRPAFNQQYSVGYSGGSPNNNYYFSAGFNKNLQELTRNSIDRYTLFAAHSFRTPKSRLEIYTSASLSHKLTWYNNDNNQTRWPYLQLANAEQKALSVPYGYGRMFTDTAGNGKLLDWNFRPLDQLNNANHTIRHNEARLNLQIRYQLFKQLLLSAGYQYTSSEELNQNYYSPAMYETRNLINTFSQINSATGTVSSPIPYGGIMQETEPVLHSQNIRLMAQWQPSLAHNHTLSSIAGYDIRIIDAATTSAVKYGYNDVLKTEASINYNISYPTYPYGALSTIPHISFQQKLNNNYLSWFINNNYAFQNRYFVSFSLRRDESNLFGVNINNKGIPLWAAGMGWLISKEKFFHGFTGIDVLKLRATMGYTGNVNTALSAFNTASRASTPNRFGSRPGTLSNPANPNLGWEKVKIVNLGIDVSLFHKKLQGSLEVYRKDGSDLIGPVGADPTTGITTYTGNAANTASKGIDITLSGTPINKKVKWDITVLFTYNQDKVTRYTSKQRSVSTFLSTGQLTPMEGRPLYALYSLPYLGLNEKGAPIGILNGVPTTEYSNLFNSFNLTNIKYHGPVNPTTISSIIQNITFRQFTLSLLLTFKGGYFYRRPGINYIATLADNSGGHPEYSERWEKPGDELFTRIPSLTYPFDQNREDLYKLADILVERGDHLRLQDIKLSWQPLHKKLQLYTYINNIGILWRANHSGIDPDHIPYGSNHILIYPSAISFTAGINFNF